MMLWIIVLQASPCPKEANRELLNDTSCWTIIGTETVEYTFSDSLTRIQESVSPVPLITALEVCCVHVLFCFVLFFLHLAALWGNWANLWLTQLSGTWEAKFQFGISVSCIWDAREWQQDVCLLLSWVLPEDHNISIQETEVNQPLAWSSVTLLIFFNQDCLMCINNHTIFQDDQGAQNMHFSAHTDEFIIFFIIFFNHSDYNILQSDLMLILILQCYIWLWAMMESLNLTTIPQFILVEPFHMP